MTDTAGSVGTSSERSGPEAADADSTPSATPNAEHAEGSPSAAADHRLNVRQAAFIGVAAMVGAGIFSLLGAAGAVAGAAVWLSFLLAGVVALLQGYSFAKFGARYPTAGGILEYVRQGFGNGHLAGIVAWLMLAANAIVTGMVAVSFGSYASATLTLEHEAWVKLFAILLLLVMTLLNLLGSRAVARTQTVIVVVVIGILTLFSVVTLANLRPHLLAPSGYPSLQHIVSGVALTFFAFLGFGVVTFTAKDLANPARQLPRALYLALGIATVIYVAVSICVFGTLSVEQVIASGGTALAVAAQPVLGRAGYWMMTVTALFATSGATNAGLYPPVGMSEEMAAVGQFPPVMARRLGAMPMGLALTAVVAIVLAAGFRLEDIADVGSAVALSVFALVSIAHVRARGRTGAHLTLLVAGFVTTVGVLVTFIFTTLIHETTTLVVLFTTIFLCVALDWWWKRSLHRRAGAAIAIGGNR